MKTNLPRQALAFILALTLLLPSCGSQTAATTMHLRQTAGTVGVSDDAGKALEPAENLGLYSGYGVETQAESYAWVDLDEVKLTKLDENSEIEITKDGKKLDIEIKSGALFFNVTEPLAEDETLNIHTSTMVVGIRGTCGWVEVPNQEHMNVYLLEGTVACSAGEQTVTVSAGEMAELIPEPAAPIIPRPFTATEVKPFVQEEAGPELLNALPLSTNESSADNNQVKIPENGVISGGEWGDITVDNENVTIYDAIVGNIIASSGNVTVYGNTSAGDIKTSSGNVIVYGGASIGDIKTSSGNVTAYDVSTGDIETDSGNITVYGHTNTGSIVTRSGRIQDTRS